MVGPFCLQSVSFPHLFKVMTQPETLGQQHDTLRDFQLFASSFLRILPNLRPSITVQDISWRKEKKTVFVTICSSRTIRTFLFFFQSRMLFLYLQKVILSQSLRNSFPQVFLYNVQRASHNGIFNHQFFFYYKYESIK